MLSLLTFTIIRWILKLLQWKNPQASPKQFPNPTQVIQLIQSHTHSVLKCLYLVKTLALFQTLEEPWVRQTDWGKLSRHFPWHPLPAMWHIRLHRCWVDFLAFQMSRNDLGNESRVQEHLTTGMLYTAPDQRVMIKRLLKLDLSQLSTEQYWGQLYLQAERESITFFKTWVRSFTCSLVEAVKCTTCCGLKR